MAGSTPSPEDARIENELTLFQSIVNPLKRAYTVSFVIQVAYYVALVLLAIYANWTPTFATATASLGLGTLGVGANFGRLQTSINQYLNERAWLETIGNYIRLRKEQCSGDVTCLEGVESLLNQVIEQILDMEKVTGSGS